MYCLLGLVSGGCPGDGPVDLLVQSACVLDCTWDPGGPRWVHPGLPMLSDLAGPYEYFSNFF